MKLQRLSVLYTMLAALAAPLGAQEGEAPAKPDPEVDKQIDQFKDAVNERDRSRDDEAMNLIDKMTAAYPTMHAKDQKNVRKTLEECLVSNKVVRPPEHSRLFLAAAAALGVEPAHAAVFEDAVAGVEAGRAGSFGWVVGVDRVGQADALRRHGADVVVADLSELLEER